MKNTLTYTEAAELLGVHRQSVANYVDRGLLVRSTTNRKAVTRESVENLMNQRHDFVEIAQEVDVMKDELLREKDLLATAREDVKSKIEYNKAKGIAHQNIGYICDALLVYLDSFGDKLSTREKKVVRSILAYSDMGVVGDEIGLTANRVREIYQKSLRRLANSQRVEDLKQEYMKMKQDVEVKDEIIKSLKMQIGTLKNQLHIEEIMSGAEEGYVSVDKRWLAKLGEVSMSVRSYNVLRAVGLEYAYELAFLSRNDMIRYRNFGRKSLNEVEMLKDELGMPEHALKDINEFNKHGGKERVAAPYALLEGRRRQLR